MALIIFSHANSYGAATYARLFDALRNLGHIVEAIEQYGLDPRYPINDGYAGYRSQLLAFATAMKAKHGQSPVLMGHSLGGAVSTWVASSHPGLCKAVVILDSFVYDGWRAWCFWWIKKTGAIHKRPPASVALRRRFTWDSHEQMFSHLRKKRAYQNWDEQVLWDYVRSGTQVLPNGKVTLKYKRELEAACYACFPHNLMGQLKKHPLQCPYHFIGGEHSQELRQSGVHAIQRLVAQRSDNSLRYLPGGHLFPMERPIETAHAVHAVLASIESPSMPATM